jgi:hypothetical protein
VRFATLFVVKNAGLADSKARRSRHRIVVVLELVLGGCTHLAGLVRWLLGQLNVFLSCNAQFFEDECEHELIKANPKNAQPQRLAAGILLICSLTSSLLPLRRPKRRSDAAAES